MRKWIIAAIVAAALFAIGAFAASFSLNAQDVSSGADAVAACPSGTSAKVTWNVDDSNAVVTTTANFIVTGASITTEAGCAGMDYRFAFESPAGTEYLCKGLLDGTGARTITFATATSASTAACGLTTGTSNPFGGISAGTIKVQDVTAASLLVAGNPVGVTTTP
jgi:hypothetical protein